MTYIPNLAIGKTRVNQALVDATIAARRDRCVHEDFRPIPDYCPPFSKTPRLTRVSIQTLSFRAQNKLAPPGLASERGHQNGSEVRHG